MPSSLVVFSLFQHRQPSIQFQIWPLNRNRGSGPGKAEGAFDRRAGFQRLLAQALPRLTAANSNAQSAAIPYPLENIEIRDTTFAGLDGTIVKAWIILRRPPGTARCRP